MRLTTPPRPIDLESLFPDLAGQARIATRLHPRPGVSTVHESSVGGPMLWPADEPWPVCPGEHPFSEDGSDHLPLVPVLQLYLRDAPTMPHPPGADLMQLMWCPTVTIEGDDHSADEHLQVFWRRTADVHHTADRSVMRLSPNAHEGLLPRPCVIHPEEVTEYPTRSWMSPELAAQIEAWEGFAGEDVTYDYDGLAVASGLKVGGWATAETFWGPAEPGYFTCTCGAPLDALVLFGSEWDGDATWRPVEDSHDGSYEYRRTSQLATDLEFGRGYALQTYYCTASWDHPVARYMQ